MKYSIIIFFFVFSYSNLSGQNFERISKEIFNCHQSIQNKGEYNKHYYNLREKTQLLKQIHGKLKRDTIYLIEFHGDIPTQNLYLSAWSKSDTIYIKAEEFGKGKLLLNEEYSLFPRYMCYLVSRWNIEELEKEGKLHPASGNVEYVYATRIIINRRKYFIDCIMFRYFFKFDRDHIYHIEYGKGKP